VIARLETRIAADTGQNAFQLRPRIAAHIADLAARGREVDLATLNTWIYAEVFHTPASDPWLGLLPRTDFTGLPGDGALVPPAPQ